jgi:hypothetical protein
MARVILISLATAILAFAIVAALLPALWPIRCVHSQQSQALLCFISPQEAFVRWVTPVALGLAMAIGTGFGVFQALRNRSS